MVADELERRWNRALEQAQELEQRIEQLNQAEPEIEPAVQDEFIGLADELETVWADPQSDARLKKRIVRTLMKEVLVDIDAERSEIVLTIHWQGGVHTETRFDYQSPGLSNDLSTAAVVARVLFSIRGERLEAHFEMKRIAYELRRVVR